MSTQEYADHQVALIAFEEASIRLKAARDGFTRRMRKTGVAIRRAKILSNTLVGFQCCLFEPRADEVEMEVTVRTHRDLTEDDSQKIRKWLETDGWHVKGGALTPTCLGFMRFICT